MWIWNNNNDNCYCSVHEGKNHIHALLWEIRHQMLLSRAEIMNWNAFCLLAKRVSQLKLRHFWVTVIERNVFRCTFNRYIVITQFAKLAAREQLCRLCTHRKLQHFKTFKSFSWKITNFELWHCCGKWTICCQRLVGTICSKVYYCLITSVDISSSSYLYSHLCTIILVT